MAKRTKRPSKKDIACYCILEQKKGKYIFEKIPSTERWQPGKWNLPGGKMNFGETPEQTVRREVREETGKAITNLELFTTEGVVINTKGKKIHAVRIIFSGKAKGKLRRNEESSAFKILTLAQAEKLVFVPGLKKVIHQFRNRHK